MQQCVIQTNIFFKKKVVIASSEKHLTQKKKIKDVYTEIYKTALKEITDLNKWKDTSCLWIRKFNTVKIPTYDNLMHRFNTKTIKITGAFYVEINKQILKSMWNARDPEQVK